jgi:DNA-binding NarL/FixJ family response regulator
VIPVLIADDHPIFRRGLRAVIDADPHLRVIAEAGGGRQALELLRAGRARVAVLDISMPDLDGLTVLEQSRTWPRPPRVALLTMHDDYVERAFALGALGYLLKENAEDEVVACLHAVDRGDRFIGAGIGWRPRPGGGVERGGALAALSPGERRVLRLLAELRTTRDIAGLLCISPRTVQNHRAHMCVKLELRGPKALLRFALEHRDELE